VTSAYYDQDGHAWTVLTDTGESVRARFLIMATGCLSSFNIPDIPGLDSYRGPVYQTGRWPRDGVDFTGLRVGVIGTGSSGIQSIPLIADQAVDVTVFQRTPNFTQPALNRPLDPDEVRERKASYPEFRARLRATTTGVPKPAPTRGAREVSAEERQAAYEQAWSSGLLGAFSSAFTDILSDWTANETAAEFVRDKIRSIVHDPETAEALCPYDYPIGTKRPCLDTGYYATYNRPHVHLVDLRKTPIERVTESGIRTSGREHRLDAIVLATGFDAMTGALTAIDITGKEGRSLRAKWSAGPRNYLGLVSAGFPNLFTITGPLSPSVISNMMVSIEQHVDWVTDCIAYLRASGMTEIDATAEAEDGWVVHVAEAAARTLYQHAASWYMGANVPGKPRVFMPYLAGVAVYRAECADVVARDYAGFVLSP
jgi:cyclohexanone monooxygenase